MRQTKADQRKFNSSPSLEWRASGRSSSLFKIDHPTRQGISTHHIRVTKALAMYDGFSKLLRTLYA
jgi:hypothetical protein